MPSLHDRLWSDHPHVRTGNSLTRGERAADRMKQALATWTALIGMGLFIFAWMIFNSHLGGSGHHFDPYPWILLNLCLSTLAGLQCFVLLIANRRGEEIAAVTSQATLINTAEILRLVAILSCDNCGAPVKPDIDECPYCKAPLIDIDIKCCPGKSLRHESDSEE